MKKLSEIGHIHDTAVLHETYIGDWCEIGAFTAMSNVRFGDYSYVCNNCILQNVEIGKFSNIAAHVRIGATDHPMERPTMHHFTYRSYMYEFAEDDAEFFAHRASRMAHIGHDTWIGHGAMIKPGIRVGNGAVIGSGSVVTKDVQPYTIVAGNPAKIIRYRFNKKTIEGLEQIKWWDWSHEQIKANFMDFRDDAETFVDKHSG